MTRRVRWGAWLGAAFAATWAAPAFAWELRLAAGAGIGTRALDLPRDGVVYETRTRIFPAADLGFALEHELSTAVRLGLRARYLTSIGLRITEQHTGGSTHTQNLRSHRLELSLAPTFRLDARGRWQLSAAIGYGGCDLRPEIHLQTPGYGLAGPFLRVELQFPLGADRVRLRLGPEAQWIVQVGRELTHEGFANSGLGAGGTAALEVVLGKRWIIEAAYSELHAWLDSPQPESLVDVSRFVTARLSGAL
jgi:hypothetical protein